MSNSTCLPQATSAGGEFGKITSLFEEAIFSSWELKGAA
jgi:hypothetical protein